MSWLLFMDESGHDHKQMPYEVRGGVAIHASKLWPFVQAMRRLEREAFGVELATYRKELKGSKLLDKRHLKWAGQGPAFAAEVRRKHCRALLVKGLTHANPTWQEFTAFGQANREMAQGVFRLLAGYEATVFAVAIPRGAVAAKADPAPPRSRRPTAALRDLPPGEGGVRAARHGRNGQDRGQAVRASDASPLPS
jgi:hypothetical protein